VVVVMKAFLNLAKGDFFFFMTMLVERGEVEFWRADEAGMERWVIGLWFAWLLSY
jgi:hypothetical protein